MRAALAMLAGLIIAMSAPGCGGDDGTDDDGQAGASNHLADAVAKTEAAKTARMVVDVSVTGGADESFHGEVLVDFEHDRNKLTLDVRGQTVQLFSDGSDDYVRQGTAGRYRRFPKSEESPVANDPSDSLQYLGTDVVDVTEGNEAGCYEGKLDFDRVFRRVEEGREGDLPEELRGQQAPVLVCVDRAGRIRRYDVEISVRGTTIKTRSTLSDHGRVPLLDPLGPAELPR
jgi:hypothetical protein